MKKYKSFMFIFLGLLFVLAFAPLSVNAAESNGSSILDWDYTSNADGSITLTKYKGTSKDIVVPGRLDGKQVKIESFKKVGIDSGHSLVIGTSKQKVIYDGTSLTNAFSQSTYENIDLKGLDTSKVTNMQDMFEWCDSLTTLDVSNLDTSNVTIMNGMFDGCRSLTALDVSNFDTSKVTLMDNMFHRCCSLTALDVSNFDTSNVTNMGGMFSWCESLTTLDVSNFNTSKVTNMRQMFGRCMTLKELDVSNFKTSADVIKEGMFSSSDNLVYVNLGNIEFKKDILSPDHNWVNRGFTLSENAKNDVPSVIISQNENTKKVLSDDGGKSLIREELQFGTGTTHSFTRVAYAADVKLDANGGTFKERTAGNEKTITLGGNVFYDTVDAYKNEFTVTNDNLAEKTSSPTKDGKEFNGWYLDKECTKPFTTLDMTLGHDSKVTLYAGYKAKKAEIDNPGTDKPAGDKNNGIGNPAEKMVNAVQTGDVSSPYFWAFIALLAMIGAAGTVLVRRKIIRTN